jgi:hypothetical protein
MKVNKLLNWTFPMIGLMNSYIDDPDGGGANDAGGGNDDAGGGNDDAGGGPSENGGDVVGSGNANRLALLDAINDSNDALRADELADVNDDGSTQPFLVTQQEGDQVLPLEPAPVDQLPAETALTPVTKIKVNGQDVELTPELIAKAQKIASADTYLEEAAAARKAATPAAPAPAPVPNAAPLPSPEDVEREALERDLALVRAIQVGTEEEAVAAIRKITRAQPVVSADDIGRIADERLDFKTAIGWFNDEYKDLVSDPQLHQLVLQRDQQLIKEGDKRPYKERYAAVGEEVRAWRQSLVEKFTPAPAPALASAAPTVNKLERKIGAPTVPVAASTRAKPAAPDDDGDETPTSVIAKMAQSRGGPQWARN